LNDPAVSNRRQLGSGYRNEELFDVVSGYEALTGARPLSVMQRRLRLATFPIALLHLGPTTYLYQFHHSSYFSLSCAQLLRFLINPSRY
jgi:hypothetical protein